MDHKKPIIINGFGRLYNVKDDIYTDDADRYYEVKTIDDKVIVNRIKDIA